MPKRQGLEVWDGGYIYVSAAGKKTYYIRRSVGGITYEVSTRCSTATAAYEALRRFEDAPPGYQAGKSTKPTSVTVDVLLLTDSLAQRFLDHSAGEGNVLAWRKQQAWHLKWWGETLAGKNLRALDLRKDIELPLGRVKSRAGRVAVLKALYRWLRKVEHLVSATQDPTQDLPTPQSKRHAKRRVISDHQLSRVLDDEALDGRYKSALMVLAGTGWHVTALCRFARSGLCIGEADNKYVLISPKEKDGEPIAREVSLEVWQAGKRLRDYGHLAYHSFWKAVQLSCKRQGILPFAPGSFRHTVTTYALAHGATVGEIQTHHRHKDTRTTWRYADQLIVTPKIPTPK